MLAPMLGFPGARALVESSRVLFLASPCTDNLWSAYADRGVFVEKTGVPSVPVPEESRAGGLPYVLTDIMTYFTMLVGIYFPSVTGEPATRSACTPPSSSPPRPRSVPRLGSGSEPWVSAPCLSESGLRQLCGLRELCPCSPERPVT